ncbi:hypothetical protein M9H77_08668 [Catharanthus roseus]|uniref:Uncharacterized protein n=1 Tax=Catharanthus roseus TaxID=4058 RepID=A0ACC0BYR8_CATRO|nr:hypothetical protein M9H77_08668 [Catharanthus roseus]
MLGAAPQDSSCSIHGYSHAEYGVSSSDPYVPRPANKADERGDDDGDSGDDDQDEGDDAGDEEQPVPVAPASGSDGRPHHGKGKWLMQDRDSLKCRSHYMALTSWELNDVQALIYLYFPMSAPPAREIRACWVSTWHEFVAYVDYVESYMLDWILRQFGYRQCIPAHPIQPQEARRLPNNRMYVLRNTFMEALWLEAPSHLLTESWTSVPAIPSSSGTDYYMGWYLPCSHPRIQNPENIPSGFHVPVAPVMSLQALLDLIAHEATREDLEDNEFRRTMNIVPALPSILETRGRAVVDPNRARKTTHKFECVHNDIKMIRCIHLIVSRRRTLFLIRLSYQLSDTFY